MRKYLVTLFTLLLVFSFMYGADGIYKSGISQKLQQISGKSVTGNMQSDSKGVLLWDNTNISVGTSGIISTELGGLAPDPTLVNTADDFVVPVGEAWAIDSVYTEGFSLQTTLPDAFGVTFYEDAGGMPGEIIYHERNVPANGISFDTQELKLVDAVVLQAGTYWISVYGMYNDAVDLTNTRWNWYMGSTAIGYDYHVRIWPEYLAVQCPGRLPPFSA
jgi:hypothetical protein